MEILLCDRSLLLCGSQAEVEHMTHRHLPRHIEVYEIQGLRLYVKTTGLRDFAIWEDELTPRELVGIARDIRKRRAKKPEPQLEASVV